MTYKDFFLKKKELEFNLSKKICLELNSKVYIRDSLGDSVFLLDNNNTISNGTSKVGELGYSFFSKKMEYKNKIDPLLKVISFHSFYTSKKETSLNLKNSINLAAGKKSKISKLLIITNPVKGGFYGYSNNFRGFIPKSQIHLFIKDSYSRLFPLIKKLKGVKIKKHYYRLLIKKNFYIRLKSSLNTVKSFIVNKKLNQGR